MDVNRRKFTLLKLETPENLVLFMKERNIKFEKVSEEEAIIFLQRNTYYKKISSYKNNFNYYISDNKKLYRDLDFRYLMELSILDMEFRFLVLNMCLNIEHTLKIRIMNKCLEHAQDGYTIVREFFNKETSVKVDILKNAHNSYCTELIRTHQEDIPIWVMLETISFGGLCHFYKFLTSLGYFPKEEADILFVVRDLRNAAAHNHCLFSKLIKENGIRPLRCISQYVASIEGITSNERKARLSSRCIKDFVTLLYAFHFFIDSDGVTKHTHQELKNLFYNRMLKNKEFFSSCLIVKNAYKFTRKVLDNFLRLHTI